MRVKGLAVAQDLNDIERKGEECEQDRNGKYPDTAADLDGA